MDRGRRRGLSWDGRVRRAKRCLATGRARTMPSRDSCCGHAWSRGGYCTDPGTGRPRTVTHWVRSFQESGGQAGGWATGACRPAAPDSKLRVRSGMSGTSAGRPTASGRCDQRSEARHEPPLGVDGAGRAPHASRNTWPGVDPSFASTARVEPGLAVRESRLRSLPLRHGARIARKPGPISDAIRRR